MKKKFDIGSIKTTIEWKFLILTIRISDKALFYIIPRLIKESEKRRRYETR